MNEQDRRLSDRYGDRARAGRRWMAVAAAAVLGLALAGWALWAAWSHGTPVVTSQLQGFDTPSQHEVVARVQVELDEDALGDGEARCLLRALARDHAVVGELSFEPEQGLNEVRIRTDRQAVSVDPIGCTAPGQSRAR